MAKIADKVPSAPERAGGRKGLLLAILVGIGLLGSGGAAALLLGREDSIAADAEEGSRHEQPPLAQHDAMAAHAADPREHGNAALGQESRSGVVFVDMPDVLVNLRSDARRMRFLKLRVALEVGSEHTAQKVGQVMPRVLDSFQLYLRDLTLDELNGAEGLQRLKEELMARVNIAIEPIRVDDILFKEMLVQ